MSSTETATRGPSDRRGPVAPASSGLPSALREKLLDWYVTVRRDLPWRRTRDPYAVWLSETMLQQTRVETVVPYYQRFMRELPTMAALAEASEERVLALWSGLGYYRRARMLHAAAKEVVRAHGGRLPTEAAELRRLEGIGAYTAGAIASIAFARREAVVDGNVARVLARLHAIEGDIRSSRVVTRLWTLARDLLPGAEGDPGDWNQALMELGATVCLPRLPRCDVCPVHDQCAAHARGIERELPRSVPKKRPIVVRRLAVVLASPRAVLLARRRADVLFGGLWEPPTSSNEGSGDLTARLGLRAQDLEHVGDVVHVLSHRRMTVEVRRGRLERHARFEVPGPEYDAIERVDWSRIEHLARAALTRKILQVAKVAPRGLRLT
ncbi:MAG TPA: A/G-specific adenine glycosylase [Polyangiaceae bacterium]|nr:A/G-specific adenine glycosylase [Polyangiaceae bacterium]